MKAYKFVMGWVRFTLLVATVFFLMSVYQQNELGISVGIFIGTLFASALLYCSIVFSLATISWVWNGNKYIKKNLPSEDVINP